MNKVNKLNFLLLLCMLAFFVNGCLNVRQKATLNEDGSGTIDLHYWMTSQGDIPYGDEIDGYSFIEVLARKKYESPNTEIKTFRKFRNPGDTTDHIELSMNFKDINKLSETPGFSRVKVSYVKGKDGYDFKYFLPKDTSLKKEYIRDSHILEYTFTFPKEIGSTNGIVETGDKNTVKWKIPVREHKEKDFEMTAVIKEKTGICGLFGFELPLILITGLTLMQIRKRKS